MDSSQTGRPNSTSGIIAVSPRSSLGKTERSSLIVIIIPRVITKDKRVGYRPVTPRDRGPLHRRKDHVHSSNTKSAKFIVGHRVLMPTPRVSIERFNSRSGNSDTITLTVQTARFSEERRKNGFAWRKNVESIVLVAGLFAIYTLTPVCPTSCTAHA